jgi:hypothetical protein
LRLRPLRNTRSRIQPSRRGRGCCPAPNRTDDQLRAAGGHLLWHARQICFLAAIIDRHRKREGLTRIEYAADAATLEAFLVHIRALGDFLWGTRSSHGDDVLASDYFREEDGPRSPSWLTPGEAPDWWSNARKVIGYGVLHISFKRLRLDEAWAWDHGRMARAVIDRLRAFADAVPDGRLDPGWADRLTVAASEIHSLAAGSSVGTPVLSQYRIQPLP